MNWEDLNPTGFDFETSGSLPEYALQPHRFTETRSTDGSWLTSVSYIRPDGKGGLKTDGSKLFPSVTDLKTRLERAVADGETFVGWNVAFDIAWLFAAGLGELAMKVKWLDVMLLWRHLEVEPEYEFQSARHKKKSYALKPGGIEKWLPSMKGYNDDVDFHSTAPSELNKLQKYNDRDSVCTWIIGSLIWPQLAPHQQKCALIEAQCLPMVAKANYTGLPIDPLATNELYQWLGHEAEKCLIDLEPHGVTAKVVRSPKQLSELLFQKWGLPVLKEGKSGPSTDKEVLHGLAFRDPRAKRVKEFREALNNQSKFAKSILDSVEYNGDGRSRPGAIVFGTYSGRLTYGSKQGRNKDARPTGFALHQTKREGVFRDVVSTIPGYTLVEFDAAGQEYRWMAILSGDQTMLNLCMPGEDPHSFMGARIVDKDYHATMAAVKAKEPWAKPARQLGKVGNLSLQYRTSAKKLRVVARVQYELPMELPEAERIWKTYRTSYKEVPRYWTSSITKAQKNGYAETLAGRRVQLHGDWTGEYGWSMESTALNFPVQGVGADQKYLALMVLKDYLNQIGAYFAWDLHDGIYMYIPDGIVASAIPKIKQLLDNLPYRQAWGFTPPIPMPWDCKYGKTGWGSMQEWDFN